ncbi:MAG: hypothetical protein ACRC51_08860 [Cetobacterium sp.]
MNKKIVIVLYMLMITLSYAFRVDGVNYNQRMDGPDGGYHEMTVRNNSLNRTRYRINILESEISKYVEVYPKVVTINPKDRQILKIYVKAPVGLEKKEYDLGLQFQAINIPTLSKSLEGRVVGTANISIAPTVWMKGYIGEIDFSEAIKVEDIKVSGNSTDGTKLTAKISNDSYASIDFNVAAYGAGNYLYDSAMVSRLAKNTKNTEVELKFPKIKNPKDLKKIVLSRDVAGKRTVIKEIEIK